MASSIEGNMPDRALAAAYSVSETLPTMTTKRSREKDTILAQPSSTVSRIQTSNECCRDHFDYYQRSDSERGTYLYLGYGSNLSNETFRGSRGIKPLSQVNVQVPSLRLTFDLPGIPYREPCFANSGRRDPEADDPSNKNGAEVSNEKSPLLGRQTSRDKYRKDRWHKGLIGVVYEVTPADYAHIIQTEGGGASYQDIQVDCHPFATLNPADPVPQNPTLPPFKAHTLFAPALDPSDPPPTDGGRFQRPDPSYAQASARYLKLMTDGASELGLPHEYQTYLHSLRPYTTTSAKQRVGEYVFLSLWFPIVMLIFAMGKMFADDKGRLPAWLRELSGAVFKAVWASYDNFFKGIFGDGERTVYREDEELTEPEDNVVANVGRRARSSEDEKV